MRFQFDCTNTTLMYRLLSRFNFFCWNNCLAPGLTSAQLGTSSLHTLSVYALISIVILISLQSVHVYKCTSPMVHTFNRSEVVLTMTEYTHLSPVSFFYHKTNYFLSTKKNVWGSF